uniref:UBA domain-containing protein n=2 Tax=Musa acuminata subsp. malaccensis TaxID=214687 RepID=A0A804IFZ5_MUSAM|nr:PREDICTED: ATPase WRNIP1 [Musa acuminata subsp. malaccensis]
MEQLLSMGFSEDLASEALAATGGHSPLAAADWILTRSSSSSSVPPPPLPPSQSPSTQPCLERFFASSFAIPKTLNPSSSSSAPKTPNPSTSTSSSSPSSLPIKRRHPSAAAPLSDRMRPGTLDSIVGQDHLLGPSSLLRSSLLPSLVLWGPPGSGKTTLARALAASLPGSLYTFVPLSAVSAGVRDLRDAIDGARRARSHGRRTVLFVDEIHRFSKSQQDSFLPAIEDGSIILVGATTENPSFQLTTPLLSRCRVLSLQPLKPQHIEALLRRALSDPEKGLQVTTQAPVSVNQEAIDFLSLHCDGDARVALNALEIAAMLAASRKLHDNKGNLAVTLDQAKEAMQCKHLAYDRAGEEHYNLISALHKSMRGSDADAAIYWLARMLEGGEQPLYIARRLVRFASEDVGLADPSALSHAVACYQSCHFLGMPECDVCLAQCVTYLALAPKSVAVYRALGEAKRVVKESSGGNEGVPLHLRNAPTKLMKDMGYGKDYMYPPDHKDCSSQTYLPPSLLGHKFLDWPPQDE